jgi:hypothetical protein
MFRASRIEVYDLPEIEVNNLAELIRQARERFDREIRDQVDQLGRIEDVIRGLRDRHREIEAALGQQFRLLEQNLAAPSTTSPSTPSLEKVLIAVRNLITSTIPEQVLRVLTDEAAQMGVRAAVFDVRGKAAWGASAGGFGSDLSEAEFRKIVVPLNRESAFRQVYETGGHVDGSVDLLKKSRNVFDKLKPRPANTILLLPIRSAGSVSAIFYADNEGRAIPLPVDALKILAEFAGAQLDRLMALSGMMPQAAAEEELAVDEPPVAPTLSEIPQETDEYEPVDQQSNQAEAAEPPANLTVEGEENSTVGLETTAIIEEPATSTALETGATAEEETPVEPVPASEVASVEQLPVPNDVSTQAVEFDPSQLSEEEQRIHKDARRFARLLVSEIDLYNKAKVADGRRNKDLYARLKTDIERSRQTFEKRFGKTVVKQFDYFHDELVRTLACNDPSLLGSDYPGPSV